MARPKNGDKANAKDSTESKSRKQPIEQYDHKGKKRVNNPLFELGEHKRAAVKVIDDRGIESLKAVSLG